jgi:hypothetical protein
MKTITIYRKGKQIKVPIIFSIFDISSGIFDEPFETSAKDSRQALKMYLLSKGSRVKFIRSNDKHCEFCVSPIFYEDSTRYRAGKRIWYKIY